MDDLSCISRDLLRKCRFAGLKPSFPSPLRGEGRVGVVINTVIFL